MSKTLRFGSASANRAATTHPAVPPSIHKSVDDMALGRGRPSYLRPQSRQHRRRRLVVLYIIPCSPSNLKLPQIANCYLVMYDLERVTLGYGCHRIMYPTCDELSGLDLLITRGRPAGGRYRSEPTCPRWLSARGPLRRKATMSSACTRISLHWTICKDEQSSGQMATVERAS